MSARSENRLRSVTNSACSVSSLQACRRSSVRYQCCNCPAATRTRGVRLAWRSALSRQQATKRRPARSQTKSLSNHCARMLAAGRRESIANRHQRPIAKAHYVTVIMSRQVIEYAVEAELAPDHPRRQHRSPIPRAIDILALDAVMRGPRRHAGDGAVCPNRNAPPANRGGRD
jgi:hypothetical protein